MTKRVILKTGVGMKLGQVVSIAFLGIGLLLGTGNGEWVARADENTLTVGIESQPKTLDPRYATDATGMQIAYYLVFSTLVEHGPDLRIVPKLAERWETPDPMTYRFYLRPNVFFHDGKPLTASDVKFTFEQLKAEKTQSPLTGTYKIIRSIRVLNPYTVEFKLNQAVASFLTSLIMPILPQHLAASDPDFSQHLVGSGPFKFVRQTPNEIILEKNPHFFLGAPRLERVVFKVIKDDNTRFLKLRKGELDLVINSIPLDKVDDFKKAPLDQQYQVIENPGLAYSYLSFNMKSPQLQNIKLRQALAHAINVPEIIKYRLKGHAMPSHSLLAPVNWFAESDVRLYPYDPETAKKLLDAGGLRDPDGEGPQPRIVLELKTSNNAEVTGSARIIQAQLAAVGIRLEVKSFEWGTFYGDIQSGNYQLTMMRWIGVTEPDFYYNLFHSGQAPPNGRNRGWYENEEVDRLTEEGRASIDPEERKSIYSRVQKIVAADLPYISLWHANTISIVHRRITGYQQDPMGGYRSFAAIVTDP